MPGTLYIPTDTPFTDPSTGRVALLWLRFLTDVQTGLASVPWASINFAGSSLADLQTKSAAALTSGTLSLARLANIADAQISATAAIQWSKLAVPTLGQLALLSNTTAAVAAGATTFIGPRGEDATEANARVPIPITGVLRKLYIKTTGAPVGAETYIYTVRVNGADTALTATITGAATTGSDTANSVAVTASDLVDIKLVTSAAAAVVRHAAGVLVANA